MKEIKWFIILRQQSLGPFSTAQLLSHPEVTPDTLAWKEGMPSWRPIKDIPELKGLFFDEPEASNPKPQKRPRVRLSGKDEVVLEMPRVDPPWIFWLIFSLLICLYALMQFYKNI
jgi:hypothetical protein